MKIDITNIFYIRILFNKYITLWENLHDFPIKYRYSRQNISRYRCRMIHIQGWIYGSCSADTLNNEPVQPILLLTHRYISTIDVNRKLTIYLFILLPILSDTKIVSLRLVINDAPLRRGMVSHLIHFSIRDFYYSTSITRYFDTEPLL